MDCFGEKLENWIKKYLFSYQNKYNEEEFVCISLFYFRDWFNAKKKYTYYIWDPKGLNSTLVFPIRSTWFIFPTWEALWEHEDVI